MVDALSEYRLKTIKDRQRLEARKLRIANERVAELEAEVAALKVTIIDLEKQLYPQLWIVSGDGELARDPHLANAAEPEPLSDPCAGFGCVDGPTGREHTKACPRFAEFEYAGGVEYLDEYLDAWKGVDDGLPDITAQRLAAGNLDGEDFVDEDSDPDDDAETILDHIDEEPL